MHDVEATRSLLLGGFEGRGWVLLERERVRIVDARALLEFPQQ